MLGMATTLYELPHSPYCIPIARMLEAAGVPFERVAVSNADRRQIIELTEGRYYQVPVLVDNGHVVFELTPDSQEVPRYVDRTYCGGRLFPAKLDGLQQILFDYIENDVESATFRLADIHYVPGIEDRVERIMVTRHKERRYGAGCVDAWRRDADTFRAEAERHFTRFESMLSAQPFLLGEQPVYTDFLLYGILGNYTFQGWNTLPATLPNLLAWQQRMAVLTLT
jgi:glutathione S-transferase